MTIKLSMPNIESDLKPRITVVGVGGAGGNAVNNMIDSNLAGVEFLVCNTDAQSLGQSKAERKIQLGVTITQGLGAGARPDVGRAAAEEALDEILDHLSGAHMVFITAGMGGGTGTGAAPVLARAAREQGILTVGVVTKPFHFEGSQRMRLAESGIEELTQYVDTLIIIPNQNLFRVANEKTTFADAFHMADNVLYSGVRGITDLMVMPGLINLDFADVRTVMSEMGKAMMGTGESDNDRRAIEAAEAAISNPLLDDITMEGAKGVLINITGGPDMTLFEVDEAANRIREEVDPEANILFGSTFDESMEGKLRVSVVATGIGVSGERMAQPTSTPSIRATAPIARRSEAAAAATTAATTMESAIAEAQDRRSIAPDRPEAPAPLTARLVSGGDRKPAEQTFAPIHPDPQPAAPEHGAESTEAHSAGFGDHVSQPVQPQGTAPGHSYETERSGAVQGRSPFIPPRPMTPAMVSGDSGQADADVLPGSDARRSDLLAQPMRRRSLFERMTAAARSRVEPAAPHNPSAERVPPRLGLGADHAAGFAKERSAEARTTADNPRAQPQQATEHLSGEHRARTKDEEILDIPAFLRRQAN